MTAQCWLHPEGQEHDVTLLEGVLLDDGRIVPADLRCARAYPDQDRRPACDINVEVIRS